MFRRRYLMAYILWVMGMAFLVLGATIALGSEETPEPTPTAPVGDPSPLHPAFTFLDADGNAVITANTPISTLKTCGTCHDVEFIRTHGEHTDGATDRNLAIENLIFDVEETSSVEMNCFLCHIPNPNNTARLTALENGQTEWASTATLLDTGFVVQSETGFTWDATKFTSAGELLPDAVTIQDPTNDNCAACHGVVHTQARNPLVFSPCNSDESEWTTLSTGQIVSPQKILNSGMNIEGKSELSRTWDVHAERVVDCVDCHYAQNNPVYYTEQDANKPDHLVFDPRRMDFGDYLYRPLHEFANEDDMRGCENCHDALNTHTWLQYTERHLAVLACESCHIPQLYAPAIQTIDYTAGSPEVDCRGVEMGDGTPANTFITGYEPVLLPRTDEDGVTKLAPYNLVTAWFWAYGENGDAVPLADVEKATATGVNMVDALKTLGYADARILGETRPFQISHSVGSKDWAIKDCQTCHHPDSRIIASLPLGNTPTGDTPQFISDGRVSLSGEITQTDGLLLYVPQTQTDTLTLYVFGHSSASFVDVVGTLMFFGVVVGVFGHSTLRMIASQKSPISQHPRKRVYMYSVYERQWHWLQTAVIFGLIFTGLIIHKPDIFGIFSFPFMVEVHNILAIILVVNAFLSLFYHVVSGEIQQFLPQPHGFFGQAISQAKYYLGGIFKHDAHPFQKSPEHKMNPLQQVTYLMILNVLLPLQIITGVLMWGLQRFPDLATSLGGLPLLAPFHTLVAWSFASFVVMHVYLTTTAGHHPLAGIESMITGWDEIESHDGEVTPTTTTTADKPSSDNMPPVATEPTVS